MTVRIGRGGDPPGGLVARNPDAVSVGRNIFPELPPGRKPGLIGSSLDRNVALSSDAEHRFLIGRNLTGATSGRDLRRLSNRRMRACAERTGQFRFIAVGHVVPAAEIIDGTHLTRIGHDRIGAPIGEAPVAAAGRSGLPGRRRWREP